MKASTELDYRRRIARVIEAILLEPGAPHTLDSLAAVAHLSPYHFHRIYRALAGESIVETVQRLRLAQAAQRLTDASARVTAVAHDAGYNSPQAFARAFRGFTGVTPSEFKARQKHLATPAASGRSGAAGNMADAADAANATDKRDANDADEANANDATNPDDGRMSLWPAVELAEIAPIDVLCLRHEGPVATIGQTFRDLMHMLRCEDDPRTDRRVGICVRDPALKGSFRYLAGIVASPDVASHEAPRAPVEPLRVDGGLYAVHRLVGPYALIAPTFRALYGVWLPQSGYALDIRPALELYRSPARAGSQRACVTDLMIPIRKD
ncbi:GyrI-like domain-containing protein [Paraburkholderia sp. BCC1876]|uniref:AraC family transcriptional regulator n=1 Tax=Paraburkholderia sp. BCC1876 TaxID=2676303 RepID=UPI001591FC9F|nr:GyrI-like domain-containing protein [Paraburkholderia sp. BCC1876]